MHNPLRSEAEAFRFFVKVGVAAAIVIAVALIFEPLAGAIVGLVIIGVGLGIAIQASRGSERQPVEVANPADGVHRIVVLANETVGGTELAREIGDRCRDRDAQVLVVTPALTRSAAEHWASDIDEAREAAQQRMESSVAALVQSGITVSGQIGDSDPNQALADALREFGADEVIISTHPPQRSRWLEGGVVERAREELGLPVTHVVVDLEAAGSA